MNCIKTFFVALCAAALIMILLLQLRTQTNETPLFNIKDIEINSKL